MLEDQEDREFQIRGGPCNSSSLPYDLLFPLTDLSFWNAAFLRASTSSQSTEGSKAHTVSFTQEVHPVTTPLSTLQVWKTNLGEEGQLVMQSAHTWPVQASPESIPGVSFLLKMRDRAKRENTLGQAVLQISWVIYGSYRLSVLHTAQATTLRSHALPFLPYKSARPLRDCV